MDILVLALIFAAGIGFWANSWGRNGWAWGIVAAIVSPLAAGIVLLIVGRSPELRSQLAAEHAMRVKAYMTDNNDI
jgi:ribose 1,5-bisphosphokinase PhnN|tara:strand:- start:227 stop:454 length:228 start_codon:yes stop_codon:yes gene_type:complete